MIHFQQEADHDMKMPWSVIVEDDGQILHGRPDAEYLVGFGPVESVHITVTVREALADPALAVGLRPVFQNHGEMFSVELPVKWATPYAGQDNEAAVTALRDREREMRGLLA